MLNNVMPQRGVFFNLLSLHTDRMVSGANATLRLISGLGNPNIDNAALIAEVNLNEDSADDIKAKTNTLAEASMKLGQAMYEASQAESAEADARADAAKSGEDVVDADFEDIDDDQKKKSA